MERSPAPGPPGSRRVVLATTAAEVPSDTASLEKVLRPPAHPAWAGRHGVERMWALGTWLRRLHGSPDSVDAAADHGADPPLPQAVHEEGLDDIEHLGAAHAASLVTWSGLLVGGDHFGHGRLELDRVFPEPDQDAEQLVVDAVGGLSRVDPAVDVGAVTGSLVELTHRARLSGDDPTVHERLLSAFLTGYRGFTSGGNAADLSVYRAAALQVALHSRTHDDTVDRAVDGRLACSLVEHCWGLGASPS